jgi:hypothetical protein
LTERATLQGVLYSIASIDHRGGNSMSDDIFGSLPEDQLFDDLNIDNLSVDLDEGNNCLIIDDCTASLKDNEIQKQFKQLVYNRRHNHLSIFLLVQSYNSIPLNIRKTINNILILLI